MLYLNRVDSVVSDMTVNFARLDLTNSSRSTHRLRSVARLCVVSLFNCLYASDHLNRSPWADASILGFSNNSFKSGRAKFTVISDTTLSTRFKYSILFISYVNERGSGEIKDFTKP